jgi:hypothetical protein
MRRHCVSFIHVSERSLAFGLLDTTRKLYQSEGAKFRIPRIHHADCQRMNILVIDVALRQTKRAQERGLVRGMVQRAESWLYPSTMFGPRKYVQWSHTRKNFFTYFGTPTMGGYLGNLCSIRILSAPASQHTLQGHLFDAYRIRPCLGYHTLHHASQATSGLIRGQH